MRNAIPVQVKAALALVGSKTAVTVEAAGADMLEVDPSAHVDADRSLISKLPDRGSGRRIEPGDRVQHGRSGGRWERLLPSAGRPRAGQLRDRRTADQRSAEQGLFHAAADQRDSEHGAGHGIAQRGVRRQDQPGGEHHDAHRAWARRTHSAMWTRRTGASARWAASVGLGFGSAQFGNFLGGGRHPQRPLSGYAGIHARSTTSGNNQTLFDRVDLQPNGKDAFHLNLFAARNWIQIPNSLRSAGAGSAAARAHLEHRAGISAHVQCAHAADGESVHPEGRVQYYGSRDPFADSPATQIAAAATTELGRAQRSVDQRGRHNLKIGIDAKQSRLLEDFGFGITDFTFNPVCLERERRCGRAGQPD